MKFTIAAILAYGSIALASPLPPTGYQLYAQLYSQTELIPAAATKNATASTYSIIVDPNAEEALAIRTNGDGYIYVTIPGQYELAGLFVGDPGVGTGNAIPLEATINENGDGGWQIGDDGRVTHTLSTPDDQFYSCEQQFDSGSYGVISFGSPSVGDLPPPGCGPIQLVAVKTP